MSNSVAFDATVMSVVASVRKDVVRNHTRLNCLHAIAQSGLAVRVLREADRSGAERARAGWSVARALMVSP